VEPRLAIGGFGHAMAVFISILAVALCKTSRGVEGGR